MKISKELMKGSTVILILTLLNRKDMYGYEMTKEMEAHTDGVFTLKEGTLYPILHTLESDKFVESYWNEKDGRKRKYYRITKSGKAELGIKMEEWTLFRSTVDRIIGAGEVG
ncbi:helix-turn-helix transcriptional regulator [Paenibacillus sp. CGMCC 1.16610]|uniref:PadR family transcriptional regulator n=1 Tax=Paenibacillus anseongense TaxID=2682845 RepID=A0ABW9U1G8_9BACL|nr:MULTISPECIES: PadR family transcriptional regulator [Paenibacillus]MBA2936953.1 helix-turn-helix transcriptional regulator [Paenibacillus sp. CGMCC 1.16610]MVQ33278.1 PadR family transcriptional regulator [Paenibacillus anseongense]